MNMSYDVPSYKLKCDGDRATVCCFGDWVLYSSRPDADVILKEISALKCSSLSFDCIKVKNWDTSFAKFFLKIYELCHKSGIKFMDETLPEGIKSLILICNSSSVSQPKKIKTSKVGFIRAIGNSGLNFYKSCNFVFDFVGNVAISVCKIFRSKAKFRKLDLVNTIQNVGIDALPIVGLISFLVGLILSFISIVQLEKFGAGIYVADLVAIAMTREMGCIMTAVIMAGRTGAAFASTIGSMNANDEVDALKTMGFSEYDFLVLPRIIALVLMMPLLCIFSDFIGVMGGMAVSMSMMDISLTQYLLQSQDAVTLCDVFSGIFKSGIFGLLIAGIGCMRGVQCGRSAEDVGMATTSAVVTSITAIIVADAIFAVIFNVLGI